MVGVQLISREGRSFPPLSSSFPTKVQSAKINGPSTDLCLQRLEQLPRESRQDSSKARGRGQNNGQWHNVVNAWHKCNLFDDQLLFEEANLWRMSYSTCSEYMLGLMYHLPPTHKTFFCVIQPVAITNESTTINPHTRQNGQPKKRWFADVGVLLC